MIPVTKHAVRRYIERVIDFPCYSKNDLREIERFEDSTGHTAQEIEDLIRADVQPKTPVSVLQNGSRRVIRGETARFVVDQGTVITCYEAAE